MSAQAPQGLAQTSQGSESEGLDALVVLDTALSANERTDLLFDAFLRQAKGEDLIRCYQQARAFVDDIERRRKEENEHLRRLTAAWQRREAELTEALLEALPPGEKGKRFGTARTMLGSTFAREKKEWTAKIIDEAGALNALAELVRAKDEEPYWQDDVFETNELVHMRPVLTEIGRKVLLAHAIELARTAGELVTWAEVSPPGFSVVTRFNAMRRPQAIAGATANVLASVRKAEDAAQADCEADFEKPEWMT